MAVGAGTGVISMVGVVSKTGEVPTVDSGEVAGVMGVVGVAWRRLVVGMEKTGRKRKAKTPIRMPRRIRIKPTKNILRTEGDLLSAVGVWGGIGGAVSGVSEEIGKGVVVAVDWFPAGRIDSSMPQARGGV